MIDLQEFLVDFVDYLVEEMSLTDAEIYNLKSDALLPYWEEFCSRYRSSSQ